VNGDGTVTTAVSLVSMVLTWALLLILSVTGGRRSAAAKPA